MTAHHFFAPDVSADAVRLTGEEARHAARVLRIRPGELITVSDGRGSVVEARVTEAGQRELLAAVASRRTIPAPMPRIIVCPALPKAGKLDLVVQKLTELGVDEIRPWPAERSIVRWDRSKAAANGERFRAVAREAAKQSKRAWLPDIADASPLGSLPSCTIVLHESAKALLHSVLPANPPEEIGLVVGPEGGLSSEEVAELEAKRAITAGLGPQILRAETAAIAVSALVLGRYGRLG